MEPDDEVYGIIENGVSTGQLVDPDGMPIDGSQRMEDQPVDPRLDQQWLDRVLSDTYPPARPTQYSAGPFAARQARAHARTRPTPLPSTRLTEARDGTACLC